MSYPLTDFDLQMLAQAEHALQGMAPAAAHEHLLMWNWMNKVAESSRLETLTHTHMVVLEQALKGNHQLPGPAIQGFLTWLRQACALTAG